MADAEADAIAVGEVAFIADGEVAGGAFVGEVLGHDGVGSWLVMSPLAVTPRVFLSH